MLEGFVCLPVPQKASWKLLVCQNVPCGFHYPWNLVSAKEEPLEQIPHEDQGPTVKGFCIL